MAEIIVSSGRTISGLTLCFGDQMFVSNGGMADSTTVNELNAYLYVYSGGTVNSTTVNHGGGFTVYDNGTANNTMLNYGGLTLSGGMANNTMTNGGGLTILSGTANNTTLNNGGWLGVYYGGTVNNTTVTGGQSYVASRGIYVYGGGTANSTTVNSGGDMHVTFEGVANSTTVNSGGAMVISSGGTAMEILENGGFVGVDSNATVTFRSNTFSGLFLSALAATVHSGTIAERTTVNSGGWFSIYNCGTANSTTINSGGSMYINSGGTANKTTINGGYFNIGSGGTANSTKLNGYMDVSSGGTMNSATVNFGGRLTVSNGGMTNSTTVNFEGSMYVSSGGTATEILENGGYIEVDSNATVTFRSNTISALLLSGSATVHSGSIADNTTINSGGYLTVFSGGMANNTTINSGGRLTISNSGTATNTMVNITGALYVSSGGTATNISASYGAFFLFAVASDTWIQGTSNGIAFEIKDAFVSGYSIINGGGLLVYSGGTADSTTLNDAYCYMHVSGGGTANRTTLNGGRLYVSNGGTANSTTVNYGGSIWISSGGTANSTMLSDANCYMYVSGGGMANNTTLNGGRLYVSNGGTANSTMLSDANCYMYLSDGGTADSTTLNGGRLYVCYGGTANDTTVNANGCLEVSGGCTAFETTVNSGGRLYVYYGGTATGKMTFESDAIVSAYNGAIIDFDISALKPNNTALVNDLTIIQGAPNFTLTIDDTQTNGTYWLAGGAVGFDKTISVVNMAKDELGTLEVGQTVNIEGTDYTLNLGEDEVLSVTVGAAAPTPSSHVACGDRDGNGVSDVMFVWTGEHGDGNYAHGYWMNGTADWWSANAPGVSPDWDNLGSYDMSGDGKADAVMFGNVIVNDARGAYIGYYQDGNDMDGWVTIGFLDNSENVTWQNKVGNLTGNAAGKNSIVWYAPDLYALGAWTDGTTDWVNLSASFGGEEWTLVGCGDFDGDGKDSVVMNYNNGQLFYAVGIGGAAPVALGNSDWRGWEIRAIGDFSGDGKDDIVLFHEDTGSMVMCANGNLDSFVSIGQLAAKDWFVVGAGDYNGDKKDDLLVRQYSTGMLGYYICADQSQWVEMGRGVGMEWTVIA